MKRILNSLKNLIARVKNIRREDRAACALAAIVGPASLISLVGIVYQIAVGTFRGDAFAAVVALMFVGCSAFIIVGCIRRAERPDDAGTGSGPG